MDNLKNDQYFVRKVPSDLQRSRKPQVQTGKGQQEEVQEVLQGERQKREHHGQERPEEEAE